MTKPESLVAGILKTRYFPKTAFLDSSFGHIILVFVGVVIGPLVIFFLMDVDIGDGAMGLLLIQGERKWDLAKFHSLLPLQYYLNTSVGNQLRIP